jgi:hypothetical protein
MMIAVDDPAFTFFVGLALLRSHLPFSSLSRLRDPLIRKLKDQLLLTDCSEIPEIISGMAIKVLLPLLSLISPQCSHRESKA